MTAPSPDDTVTAGTRRARTIIMPTRDLFTVLRDTMPLAAQDPDDLARHVVRLDWDGDDDRLHATSTNGYVAGWSMWSPDDFNNLGDDGQGMIGVDYGAVVPFPRATVVVDLGDVKEILATFKVGKKDGATPVRITFGDAGLTIYRSPDTGYSEHTLVVRNVQSELPDIKAKLIELAGEVAAAPPLRAVAYTPSLIQAFNGVRPGSIMELTFVSAKTTLVRYGRNFIGFLATTTPENEQPGTAAE